MFADTITFTIDSVAKVLNRINQDGYSSEYFLRTTADEFRAKIRHSSYTDKAGRSIDRHNVELVQTVYAATADDTDVIRKAYIVLENERDDGVTDPLNFSLGFVGFVDSANVTKLLNYES